MQFDLDGLVVLYVAVLGKVDMVKDNLREVERRQPIFLAVSRSVLSQGVRVRITNLFTI
jgi:hypothetical protein